MEALKILLVDDNVKFINSAVRYLNSSLNFELISWAESGEDALQKLDDFEPNLIIMDISMKGLNGLETTKKIRKAHPNIKIIVLTIGKEGEYRGEAIAAGANDFLSKSDFGPLLFGKIESLFGKSFSKKSPKKE